MGIYNVAVSDTLSQLRAASVEAGKILMKHYGSPTLEVRRKPDDSQVTDADVASSKFLAAALPKIIASPVFCEEAVIPFETRRHWKEYWLVDPLDGTKDFLAGQKDFTVCIALIRDGRPWLAVIHAPALGETFEAERGNGAYRVRGSDRARLSVAAGPPWRAVRSRFHDGGETDAFFERNGITNALPVGSALKFGRVAEGSANVFVRMKGCHEWDVASGELIVEEAGGTVRSLPEGEALAYNTPEAKVKPFLACGGDPKSFRFS